MAVIEGRVALLEQQRLTATDNGLTKKVDEIEARLAAMKIKPMVGETDHAIATAIVGGLQGASSAEVAKAWLKEVLDKATIQGIINIYDKTKKDEKFNGMLFVEFPSTEQRDMTITRFKDAKVAFANKLTYMNKDLPIQQRTRFSFLLGFKRLLANWGFENVSFDDGDGTISVGGTPILEVKTDAFTFKQAWLDEQWGEWKALTEDPKLNELIEAAEGKLMKAS